jgi:hypothetical protein
VQSVNWLSCCTASHIATMATMAFNNPDSTFITDRNFEGGNHSAIHQEMEQVIISLSGAIIVFVC